MLQELSSTSQIMPLSALVKIFFIACIALLPVMFKEWLRKKLD